MDELNRLLRKQHTEWLMRMDYLKRHLKWRWMP